MIQAFPPGFCIICGARPQVFKNKACGNCGPCHNCGRYEWVGSPAERRCEACRCAECGVMADADKRVFLSNGPIKEVYPSGIRKTYCLPCLKKKWPDELCQICNKNLATLNARKDGFRKDKPSVCNGCKVTNVFCWWCTAPTMRPALRKMWYACSTCTTAPCCFKGKCRPPRPCGKCIATLNHDQHDKSGQWIFFKQPVDLTRYTAEGIQDRRTLHSKRLLSAEIEVAGIRANGSSTVGHKDRCACELCWQTRATEVKSLIGKIGGSIVYDESVGEHGFEINMPPAAGDHFLRLTKEVSDLLYEVSAFADVKCGTHLHIDARDYTADDMRKLLFLYSKIEPALLRTQPSSRVLKNTGSGSHCFPCGSKYAQLDKIDMKALKPKGVEMLEPREYGKAMRHAVTTAIYSEQYVRPPRYSHGNYRAIKARYDALNVHSWFFRGTVEVRLHAGTIDADKIQKWGTLWASILDKAVEMTMKEVVELPNDPKEILLHLTPSSTHGYLMNRWAAFEKSYEGTRF